MLFRSVLHDAFVAANFVHVLPASNVFQIPSNVFADVVCTAAYRTFGMLGDIPKAIRPTLEVGRPPESLVQFAP